MTGFTGLYPSYLPSSPSHLSDCVSFLFYSEMGSHIGQVTLVLLLELKMTLDFRSSCLYASSNGITELRACLSFFFKVRGSKME